MGYNTSVIVLNDALNQIERDPDFGRKLSMAVLALNLEPGRHQDVSAGNHCNAASVIETHHADSTTLVSFGGNMGHQQLTTCGWLHHQAEQQERMCREWAGKLGFRLVKLPERR